MRVSVLSIVSSSLNFEKVNLFVLNFIKLVLFYWNLILKMNINTTRCFVHVEINNSTQNHNRNDRGPISRGKQTNWSESLSPESQSIISYPKCFCRTKTHKFMNKITY